MECICPGGGYGEQFCRPEGVYSECECYGDDITWGGSSTGWWGSSSGGWWGSGSSSGGGWYDPRIPELPPGEDCLALDQPCVGSFDIYGDDDLEAVGICSRIDGELFIQDVSTLQPLGCLQEVDGFVGIVQATVTDLSALTALVYAGGLGLAGNAELTTIDIPTLETAGDFFIYDNLSLVSFDLPNLGEIIGNMEAVDNPMLPECELEAVFTQANPMNLSCEGNLPDMCVGLCD